jgi:hypothetical protein
MRLAKGLPLMLTLALSVPVRAQEPRHVEMSDVFHPTRDLQAVTVLNQTIIAAAGVDAILAIQDYTASGTVIPSRAKDVQIPLTIRSRDLFEFRMCWFSLKWREGSFRK